MCYFLTHKKRVIDFFPRKSIEKNQYHSFKYPKLGYLLVKGCKFKKNYKRLSKALILVVKKLTEIAITITPKNLRRT